jgi:CRP-like cAMP-binding protein
MPNSGNLLLASFSESDAAALRPHLKSVHLESQQVLFEAEGRVTDVYFPTGGIISLVVPLSSGEIIEAAMVGRDGVVGAFAVLGGIAVNRAIVQHAGPALMCKASEFRSAVLQSQSLLSMLFCHEQTLYAQASQSAACMAAHGMEERLCRWLLRAIADPALTRQASEAIFLKRFVQSCPRRVNTFTSLLARWVCTR